MFLGLRFREVHTEAVLNPCCFSAGGRRENSFKDRLLETLQTRLNGKSHWDLTTFISRFSFPKILAEFYIIRENNNREKSSSIKSILL